MNTQRLLAPLTLSLALLATGCANIELPPAISTIDLIGPEQIEISKPITLKVEAKSTTGGTINVTPTFVSSNPNLVSVSSSGEITARHLTAKDVPVVITATAAGKTDTINITTYGLDVRGGTFLTSAAALRPYFVAAFRDAAGNGPSNSTSFQIVPPDTFVFPESNTDRTLSGFVPTVGQGAKVYGSPYVAASGEYRSSIIINGRTYLKVFSVDVTNSIGLPTNLTSDLTRTQITINGTLPPKARLVFGEVYNNSGTVALTSSSNTLPAKLLLSPTLENGTFRYGIRVIEHLYSINPDDSDQVNAGFFALGEKTF